MNIFQTQIVSCIILLATAVIECQTLESICFKTGGLEYKDAEGICRLKLKDSTGKQLTPQLKTGYQCFGSYYTSVRSIGDKDLVNFDKLKYLQFDSKRSRFDNNSNAFVIERESSVTGDILLSALMIALSLGLIILLGQMSM